MKTAISIPDEFFEDAEKVAKRLKISRSEFYCKAISNFIKKYRNKDVTDTLNKIYSEEESSIDPVIMNPVLP